MLVRLGRFALVLSVALAGCASSPSTDDGAVAQSADTSSTSDTAANGADAALDGAPVMPSPLGPEITLSPLEGLDFQSVPVGEARSLSFTISNAGDEPLVVASAAKGSSELAIWDDVTVDTNVLPGTTLSPGHTVTLAVTVTFAPSQVYPITTGPVGYLEVTTNDADEPLLYVPIRARVSRAELRVTPNSLVDFGLVAEGVTGVTRTVTLTNVGDLPLSVTAVDLASYTVAGAFSLVSPLALPLVLGPGGEYGLDVRFVNEGGAPGDTADGALSLMTDAAPAPIVITLRATRAQGGACELALDPPLLDFGLVRYGESKTLPITVKNVGAAACSPFSVDMVGGSSDLFGQSPTCKVTVGDKAGQFLVLNEPPAIKDLLQPGQALSFDVVFTPEKGTYTPMQTIAVSHALVRVTMLDYLHPDPAAGEPFTVVAVPPGALGEMTDCNVVGSAGIEYIVAIPPQLDLDHTEVGCASRTASVLIRNHGALPLRLCNLHLVGSDAFALADPALVPPCDASGAGGLTLEWPAALEVPVRFVPKGVGPDAASIVVVSNDPNTPELVIPLQASGVSTAEQVDTFHQSPGMDADVVLVVDDGPTMADERAGLAAGISALLAKASEWQAELHVGVVTTAAPTEELLGALHTAGGTHPRFFTSATAAGLPAAIIAVGAAQGAVQRGLDAATRAFTSPLANGFTYPEKLCATTADCVAPDVCVESVLSPGHSYCGHPNSEFLRNGASRQIIIVSDEDDTSPLEVSSYYDVWGSFQSYGLDHAHAIVGDPATGCTGPAGSAAAGDRYAEFATQSGGTVTSLCSVDWPATLAQLGQSMFAVRSLFALSRLAEPSTVTVAVDGAPCAQGWTFDAAVNAVIFDLSGPCAPGPGPAITVSYDAVCLPP